MADALALTIQQGQVTRLQSGDALQIQEGTVAGLDTDAAGVLGIGTDNAARNATSIEIGTGGSGLPVTIGAGGAGGSNTTIAGDLNVTGNEIVTGTTTFNDDTVIGDDITDTLKMGGVIINRTVAPNSNNESLLFTDTTAHLIKVYDRQTVDSSGGALSVEAGDGAVGSAVAGGSGGALQLFAGDGGAGAGATIDGGSGGGVSITSGDGGASTASGNDAGNASAVIITGGAGGSGAAAAGNTPGIGGATSLAGGAGGAGNATTAGGNGGQISLQAGAGGADGGGGAGTDGTIVIGTTTASAITLGSAGASGNPTTVNHAEVSGSGGLAVVALNATGNTTAGSYAIGVYDNFPNFGPLTVDDLQSALEAIDSAIGSGGATLQTAYAAGNTIAVTTANGSVALSNTTDVTDTLTVSRTFAGAGDGIAVTMGGGGEAVTGDGISVSMGTGVTVSSGVNVTTTHGDLIDASAYEANVSGAQGGLFFLGVGSVTNLLIEHDNVDVGIRTESTSTASTKASDLGLTAGDSGTDAAGGDVNVFTGIGGDYAATAAGAGGEFDVTTGDGGFSTVATAAGAGGAIDLNAGTGGNNTFAGAGTGGAGGTVTIDAGLGGDANNASATSGAGGDLNLAAGQAGSSTSGSAGLAGIARITGGAGAATVGTGTGDGGDVQITGGAATAGQGGSISLEAGNGSTTDGDIVVGLTNTLNVDINATQNITADASTGGISLDAALASNFTVSGATSDLTLGARGTTVTLNQADFTVASQTVEGQDLSAFTATSIVGALNELRQGLVPTLLTMSQTVNSTTAIVAGEPVAMDDQSTSARAWQADANTGDDRENAVGLAYASGPSDTTSYATDGTITVVIAGEMDVPDAAFTGGVPGTGNVGQPVFISDTPGRLTLTAPGGSSRVLKIGIVTRGGTGAVRVMLNAPDSVKL